MNNRYQPAHTWAALLLGGGGFSDLLAEGPQQAPRRTRQRPSQHYRPGISALSTS